MIKVFLVGIVLLSTVVSVTYSCSSSIFSRSASSRHVPKATTEQSNRSLPTETLADQPAPDPQHTMTYTPRKCPTSYDQHFCYNGGKCISYSVQNSQIYSCECTEGFMGERCDTKYPISISNMEFLGPNYNTEPLEKFLNRRCTGPDASQFCENGGQCFNRTMENGAYELHCRCPEGYYGVQCDGKHPKSVANRLETIGILAKRCAGPSASEFCSNGGQCFNLTVRNMHELYCECPPRYHGLRCEHEKRDRIHPTGPPVLCTGRHATEFCMNSAPCYNQTYSDGAHVLWCNCTHGFEGERCMEKIITIKLPQNIKRSSNIHHMYARSKTAGMQTFSVLIVLLIVLIFLCYLLIVAVRDGTLHVVVHRLLSRPVYE